MHSLSLIDELLRDKAVSSLWFLYSSSLFVGCFQSEIPRKGEVFQQALARENSDCWRENLFPPAPALVREPKPCRVQMGFLDRKAKAAAWSTLYVGQAGSAGRAQTQQHESQTHHKLSLLTGFFCCWDRVSFASRLLVIIQRPPLYLL